MQKAHKGSSHSLENDVHVVVCALQEHLPLEIEHTSFLRCFERAYERLQLLLQDLVLKEYTKLMGETKSKKGEMDGRHSCENMK